MHRVRITYHRVDPRLAQVIEQLVSPIASHLEKVIDVLVVGIFSLKTDAQIA